MLLLQKAHEGRDVVGLGSEHVVCVFQHGVDPRRSRVEVVIAFAGHEGVAMPQPGQGGRQETAGAANPAFDHQQMCHVCSS